MIDPDVNEAKTLYNGELFKKTFIDTGLYYITAHPFKKSELIQHFFGEYPNINEKNKQLSITGYLLDMLVRDNVLAYVGKSSNEEDVYASINILSSESHIEDLIKLGVIAKSEEKSNIDTTQMEAPEKSKETAPKRPSKGLVSCS